MKHLRRLIAFVRSEQWAMTVSVITAVLLQIPSLVDLVQGELDGVESWNIAGLATLLAGIVTRSNVWAQGTVVRIEEEALHRAPPGYVLTPLHAEPAAFTDHETGEPFAAGLRQATADVPPAAAAVPPIMGCN